MWLCKNTKMLRSEKCLRVGIGKKKKKGAGGTHTEKQTDRRTYRQEYWNQPIRVPH